MACCLFFLTKLWLNNDRCRYLFDDDTNGSCRTNIHFDPDKVGFILSV